MSNDTKLFQPANTQDIPNIDTQDITTSELHDKVKRNEEVDRLYSKYIEFMKKPIVLTYEEFQEFEILYQKKAIEDVNDTNTNKFQYYNALLKKLFNRINPYKEYHVVMPNGEYITFPPLLTPVANLHNSQVENIDIFSNILDKCIDQPWKRKSATVQLLKAIYESQNPTLIQYQKEKITKISNKMREHLIELTNNTENVLKNNSQSNSDIISDMEFILDE